MNVYVPSHAMVLASDATLDFSFWAMVGIAVATSLVWPWWKSSWGINLFLLDCAIACALLPDILILDFGVNIDSTLGLWIEIFSIAMAGVIGLWRGALIIRDQLRGAGVTPVQLATAALKSLLRR